MRAHSFKRSFTLLEMMLVLILLLGVGGFVAINYQSSLSHARFEADVKGVRAVLRSAEEAMLVGFDPFLSLSMTEKGVAITLQEAGGGFGRKDFVFPTIKKIFFNGNEPPQRLIFASGGSLYPKGVLVLEGDERAEIELKSPIEYIAEGSQSELPYPSFVREKFKDIKPK